MACSKAKIKKSTGLPRIIMVMGVQRSGGTTFLHSFDRDRSLIILKQKPESEIYSKTHLRPEQDIREYLISLNKTVVVEPKSETKFRDLCDVLKEFADYDCEVLWNYTDPVKVYYLRMKRYPHKTGCVSENSFITMWNTRHKRALDAKREYANQITFVRLEDVVEDPRVYWKTCKRLSIKGTYRFYDEGNEAYSALSPHTIQNIQKGTSGILKQLNLSRSCQPRPGLKHSALRRSAYYCINNVTGLWRLLF